MVEEYQKKTPAFDWEKGDFATDPQRRVITVTEEQAIEQIILKALQTQRGIFLIYADPENEDNDHKYGNDSRAILAADLSDDARISELQRAVKEAIIYLPGVLEVFDISVARQGASDVTASFKVKTIFDRVYEFEGVNLTNG